MHYKSTLRVSAQNELLARAEGSLSSEIADGNSGACSDCHDILGARIVRDRVCSCPDTGVRQRLVNYAWYNNSYPVTAEASAEASGVPTIPRPTSVVPAMCTSCSAEHDWRASSSTTGAPRTVAASAKGA